MNSSTNPIIGISANILTIDTGCLLGRERVFIGQDYIRAIMQAGGIPLILPILDCDESTIRQLDLVDGLLLSGGGDVDPNLYGQEPHQLLEATYLQRDLYEMTLLRHANMKKIPVLGICRGLQIMNVSFGGDLYQDLKEHDQIALQHRQKSQLYQESHLVDVQKGSILERICQSDSIRTNSLHHQAIKNLGKGLNVSGRSRDGIIEAIEKIDHPFMLGVQWHPELMVEVSPQACALFQALINASKKGKQS